jgi:hypothetical protein
MAATRPKRKLAFDPKEFLAKIGTGRKIVSVEKGCAVFSQGDECDAVFYIQEGRVKLTVVSKTGKEATIGIFGVGEFFGERQPGDTTPENGNGDRTDELYVHADRKESDVEDAACRA